MNSLFVFIFTNNTIFRGVGTHTRENFQVIQQIRKWKSETKSSERTNKITLSSDEFLKKHITHGQSIVLLIHQLSF